MHLLILKDFSYCHVRYKRKQTIAPQCVMLQKNPGFYVI